MMKKLQKDKKEVKSILDGNTIMKILGIYPCFLVGKVKKILVEKQIAGEIITEEDAKRYLEQRFFS